MLYMIVNPSSRSGTTVKRVPEVAAALRRADLAFELAYTDGPKHAEQLAARAAERDRYSAVVIVGGDGTLNEAVNGLLGSSLPVGLIPLGTGNDWAKMLDLPPNRIDAAVARLQRMATRQVDVGIANGRAFLNGLGCGVDAQVAVERHRPTRLRGFAVYAVAVARALRNYRAPTMRVAWNGGGVETRTLLAAIGNGRCIGGAFWLTPDAEVDDGLLDLCLCPPLSPAKLARYIPKTLRGTHTRLPEVTMARSPHFSITTSTPIPVHLDGELLSTAIHEIDVEVRGRALTIV
jgi:diacylglycerol kinase (ATP)